LHPLNIFFNQSQFVIVLMPNDNLGIDDYYVFYAFNSLQVATILDLFGYFAFFEPIAEELKHIESAKGYIQLPPLSYLGFDAAMLINNLNTDPNQANIRLFSASDNRQSLNNPPQ
jgi:hypothetical protein